MTKIGDVNCPIKDVHTNDDGTTAIILDREYTRTAEPVPFMITDTRWISICLPPELAAELAAALLGDDVEVAEPRNVLVHNVDDGTRREPAGVQK